MQRHSILAGLHSRKNDGVAGAFKPQLTSLVDVMTILLVFLIKSFSTEGSIVTPSDDLQLPFSTSQKPARPLCTIEITRTAVISEGEELARLDRLGPPDSMLVPPLLAWMRLQKAKCEGLAKPEVLIQCDREIPFEIVKKVMFTCSKAGFADYSLLVLTEE